MVLHPEGIHTIGGKADADIEMPVLETSPLVYFGCISKEEKHLPNLDFDLHLICPLFIDFRSPVFIDYSHPQKPKIIRENVPTNFYPLFDNIPNTAYIEYKELTFSFDIQVPAQVQVGVHQVDTIAGEIGSFEEPYDIEEESWPTCPVTGNRMTFLVQFGDIEECETVVGQDILDLESFDPYLHFGGHWYLYIFYDPVSKVVAYLNRA